MFPPGKIGEIPIIDFSIPVPYPLLIQTLLATSLCVRPCRGEFDNIIHG